MYTTTARTHIYALVTAQSHPRLQKRPVSLNQTLHTYTPPPHPQTSISRQLGPPHTYTLEPSFTTHRRSTASPHSPPRFPLHHTSIRYLRPILHIHTHSTASSPPPQKKHTCSGQLCSTPYSTPLEGGNTQQRQGPYSPRDIVHKVRHVLATAGVWVQQVRLCHLYSGGVSVVIIRPQNVDIWALDEW